MSESERLNVRAFVHKDKYVGAEDYFSTCYAIIFAIGVNNDRKQTNKQQTSNQRIESQRNDEPPTGPHTAHSPILWNSGTQNPK